MIYNQGFPMGYVQPGYQFPYQPMMQGMGNQQANQQSYQQTYQNNPSSLNSAANSQQIQNGGFVSVRSIEEARQWAVAPGNSVTFKIEGAPYVCEKTMGFSQLESPRFEIFRLVKENNSSETSENAIEPKSEITQSEQAFVPVEDFEKLRTFVLKVDEKVVELNSKVKEFREEVDKSGNSKSNNNSKYKTNEKKAEVKEDD
jgi:hypothetical protein